MNKILIANRGEIACRIARTCRRLGIKTVAVYSDADSRAMHIGACDEAIHIGAAETKRSYLNIDAVISAAKKCRADAVHPGYGFLSENPAFVEALDKESITFIGPSAEAMRALGDKLKAKALAKKLKIPVSPSVQAEFSDSRSLKHLEQQAAKIGFPLLIKAAGGGGGRGMRKIESAAQLGDALKSASREAQAFFGDATIFLEKYIKQARHIEVQVIGDQHGNVFDLLDRDCSSQRNHQKVIEEAPAPNISAKTRSAMYTAARKLAKQAKYAGAATVEFLLDAQQNFYFLEVNSRLQVEHPVTEEILGIDLVELQIEAAKGANLKKIFPFRGGKTLKPKGSAIECRLCAEKPVQGFIASTGKIHALDLQAPCSPAKLRFDCGFRSGDRISHHYDSLLGKIILHAKSRDGARLAALEVLRSSNIVGIETNSAFLEAILASADFAQGNPHLALVPSLLDRIGQEAAHRKLACALHMVAASLPQGRAGGDPWSSGSTFCAPERDVLYSVYKVNNEIIEVTVHMREPGYYQIDPASQGATFARVKQLSQGAAQFEIGGAEHQLNYRTIPQGIWLKLGTVQFAAELSHKPIKRAELSAKGTHHIVTSPLPGKILSVKAKEGRHVEAGETLLILESMKMEHLIRASAGGLVRRISVQEGNTVQAGALLLEFDHTH